MISALTRFLLVPAVLFSLVAKGGAMESEKDDDVDRLKTLHSAIDHLEEKEFLKAYDLLIPMALEGYDEAQYQIGWMYEYGQGIPVNICIATLWHDKAARQGHMMSERSMAFSYLGGKGLPKNQELAYRWFLSAVRSGLKQDEVYFKFMSDGLSPWLKQHIETTMDNWRAADQPPADVVVFPDIVDNKDLSNRFYLKYGYRNCIPDYSGTSIEKFGPKIYRP